MRGLSTRNIVRYGPDAIFRVKPSGTLFARPFCPRGTPAVAKLMPVRPNTVRRHRRRLPARAPPSLPGEKAGGSPYLFVSRPDLSESRILAGHFPRQSGVGPGGGRPRQELLDEISCSICELVHSLPWVRRMHTRNQGLGAIYRVPGRPDLQLAGVGCGRDLDMLLTSGRCSAADRG